MASYGYGVWGTVQVVPPWNERKILQGTELLACKNMVSLSKTGKQTRKNELRSVSFCSAFGPCFGRHPVRSLEHRNETKRNEQRSPNSTPCFGCRKHSTSLFWALP
mmetsp:Transcript_5002/g.14513  ORF Transcript_5002/g.14513 Transcript_5002/m.14513 type:complete len:106 (+) Transcript_5002:1082-1399(+)